MTLPEKCLRGRSDCKPLAQIQSDCGVSFICVGHNLEKDRKYKQDIFRHCWKNEEIDEDNDWDKRDFLDTISVMSQALSVDENMRLGAI